MRFTPQAAALWKSVAFDPQGADEWEKAGFTFKTAKLWRDAGFGVKDAVNLRATIPVEAAKAYKDAGLSIETTIVWAATLPAGEAQEFKKLGLAKDEERELSVIGRQIHDWQKAGFSVKDAIMWSRAQFGLSEAVKWRDAGYAPKSAADWIRGGIAKPSDAKAIGKKCPKGMEPLEVLYQLNPYDVKGRCFQFVGTTQQILSRSSGLYLLGGEAPALVNFGEHSAPPHVFRGITKGVGAYKYVAVSGSEKIVPSLEAVLVHESQ
ncbi:MAG TPA: hypothetical protein DCZ01_03730 [Elusimicrobia bacterium]|nr:MAG: hypothetical protein A2X37_05985 [Elusimicrobia bacterium GWA2_66_18]OGR70630.1 MAG: hypothetical protein A2X40_07665 [Elusimicrobia bacterium GWC2_65_9]HAZ07638.1 hypothetical protein [Elusimicrobiota bacterium]